VRSSTLAKYVAELTLTKKAYDVVVMDLRQISPVADFFVICSADSDVQVKAIADVVEEGMEKRGALPWHKEVTSINWVVLDYVDVVLHVFHKHTRSFFNLEKLWGDAKMTWFGDKRAKPASKRVRSTRAGRSRRTMKTSRKAAP